MIIVFNLILQFQTFIFLFFFLYIYSHEQNKLIFRQDQLQSHLVSCVEYEQFTMFPFYVNVRQKKKRKNKKQQKKKNNNKKQKTENKGVLYMQTGTSWVLNDDNCNEWFHKK